MSLFKKSFIQGTFWSIGGHFISLSVVLITNIWLARILSPYEFGQLGIIMFFIAVASVFTESGLSGALIRKQNPSKDDYSTIFIFNLIISTACFIVLAIFTSKISNFYSNPDLQRPLIISGLVLIINAFQISQNARMIVELRFKQKNIYNILSVLLSSSIGIISAYSGMGIWSLIYMQLSRSLLYSIFLWLFEGFYFKIKFSLSSFKGLYQYGLNTTLASLLSMAFDNIYQIIIGRFFSITQVGYFYQAKKIQDIPGGVLSMLSHGVIFSSLSKIQDDKIEFSRVYKKIVSIFLSFLGLITILLFCFADHLIILILGDKWFDSIFYMKLLSLASFYSVQENLNRVIFKVYNKTALLLYLEILKKGIQFIGILIAAYYRDINILLKCYIISSAIGYVINYIFSRKILGNFDSNEFIMVVRVNLIVSSILLVAYYLKDLLDISNSLILLPFIVLSYTILLFMNKVLKTNDMKGIFKNS